VLDGESFQNIEPVLHGNNNIRGIPSAFAHLDFSEYPITISPAEGPVRTTVPGRIIAESKRAMKSLSQPGCRGSALGNVQGRFSP
jgi:hypothetical protein